MSSAPISSPNPWSPRRLQWSLAALLGLSGLALQCGSIFMGSETHFLAACQQDSECGGRELACLCGVCTKRCSQDSACEGLPGSGSALCLTATCGTAAATCDIGCEGPSDCSELGGSWDCAAGRCRVDTANGGPAAAPSDPSPSGSGGAPPSDPDTGGTNEPDPTGSGGMGFTGSGGGSTSGGSAGSGSGEGSAGAGGGPETAEPDGTGGVFNVPEPPPGSGNGPGGFTPEPPDGGS